MSLNMKDLKTAQTEAQDEIKTLNVRKTELTNELSVITHRITTLEAMANSVQALINASGTGQDISAIQGIKRIA